MSAVALQRMDNRAEEVDKLMSYLRSQLAVLRTAAAADACRAEEEKLRLANDKLRKDVQRLKNQLVQAEVANGVNQVVVPQQKVAANVQQQQPPEQQQQPKEQQQKQEKKEKKKEKKTENKPKANTAAPAAPVDVSRLDMRVGFIVSAKKHPDADGLYVEEVDLGEGTNRTIISGLVKFVTLEQMQQRKAIFICNLKPAKMRGIMSQGMIMCASSPEIVEIIELPDGVEIGDRVTVQGYNGEPDALLNPKKKIWEQVQPDLRIDADGIATYRGVQWTVAGKGPCRVPTMRDSIIK